MPHPPRRRTGRALLRTALALVGALTVLSGPGGPGGPGGVAAHADDDDYVPSSPSTCQVDLGVDRGGRLVTVVEAHTSGNVGLRGTVRVRVTRNGRTIASESIPYRGERIEVLGPRLGKRASYVATMRFTPSGAAFQSPCSAATRLRYAGPAGSGSTDPDGGSVLGDNGSTSGSGVGGVEAAPADNGLLPGTGGPALGTFALGLGLIAVGAVVMRRRRTPA